MPFQAEKLRAEDAIAFEDLQIAFVVLRTAVDVIGAAHAVRDRTARVVAVGGDAARARRRAQRDGIGTDDIGVRGLIDVKSSRQGHCQHGVEENESKGRLHGSVERNESV